MTKLIATLAVLSTMGVLGNQAWVMHGRTMCEKPVVAAEPVWEFERVAPIVAPTDAEAPQPELAPIPRGGIVLGSRSFVFTGDPKAPARSTRAVRTASTRAEPTRATTPRPVTATKAIKDANKPITAALSKNFHTRPSFGFSGFKARHSKGKTVYSSGRRH